jgi:hypothetical protein
MVVDKTNNPVHPTTFKRKQMGKTEGNYRMGLRERTDRSATETRRLPEMSDRHEGGMK